MNFKIENFYKKNTPKIYQIIGDIGLLASVISTNILLFKQSLIDIGLTSLANNPIFDKINLFALAVGVTIKFVTKFFGENVPTPPDQKTYVHTQINEPLKPWKT